MTCTYADALNAPAKMVELNGFFKSNKITPWSMRATTPGGNRVSAAHEHIWKRLTWPGRSGSGRTEPERYLLLSEAIPRLARHRGCSPAFQISPARLSSSCVSRRIQVFWSGSQRAALGTLRRVSTQTTVRGSLVIGFAAAQRASSRSRRRGIPFYFYLQIELKRLAKAVEARIQRGSVNIHLSQLLQKFDA